MHSANALATAFVPRLRSYALLFVTALVCIFTGSLHAQTALKQINAGGAAVAPFAADNSFSAGSTFSSAAAINLTGVTNPAPQAVYQSVRWNAAFNYTLTGLTAGSSYQVRLHFVELSFTAAGQRKFNVAINGTAVLTAFDIFAQAGQNHALVQQFNATANSSGQIVVAFSQGGADNPAVAGLEVYSTAVTSRSPYGGTNWPINNGATIQTENYDLGGEGVAYHDADVANQGGQFRTDGVDIEATTDTGGGYNVGFINDSEWLDYTVNTTAGTYNIVVRGASNNNPNGGSVKVLLDGVVLGTAAIPYTGGWQTWQDFTISNVAIAAGTGRTLQLQFVGGGFNANYVRFATTTATFPLTVTNGTGSGNYAIGTVVNIVANAPGAGQIFAGWTGGTAANFGNAASASTTYTTTGAAQTITATYSTVPTFALTVSSGTGSGNYAANTVVNIVANAPGTGQVFAGWTGGTAANFGNAASASTTYKTTGAAQTITATYSTVPTFALTVSSGSGSGNYPTNTVVNIVANAPGTGQVFAGWTGGTSANFGNTASASTTYMTTGAAQTITANYTTSTGTNLAVGKPITASSSNGGFPVTNANDNNVTTYWESASIPATLTINLGANANVTSVVVNLNPASSWGNRTQTIQVLGHNQSTTTFTSLVPATSYAFSPTSGANTVTIPVSTTASQIQLAFTSNSGAPGAQAAEFQIIGTAAPTFALTVSSGTGSGNYPTGTAVNIVANAPGAGQVFAGWTGGTAASFGNVASASTTYTTTGAAQTITATYSSAPTFALTVSSGTGSGTYTAGTIVSIAANAPPAGQIFSGWTGGTAANFGNAASASTTYTTAAAAQTIVANYVAGGGPDLQVLSIIPNNSNPAAGAAVSFTVGVKNNGTTAVAAGTTTRLVVGTTTLTQSATPAIPVGTTVSVTIPGTWTAVTGSSTVTATADATNIIAETNEANNSLATTIVSGSGAAVPYTRYESEDGAIGGGAALRTAPTFDYQQTAAQASNQAYVALPSSGAYVQWTVRQGGGGAGVNMRFTMPDSADGMGLSGSLDVYVNGTKVQTIALSSFWSWQYFAIGSDSPHDTPTAGIAAFQFDEVHWKLAVPLVANDTIRIQSSGASGLEYGVDFLEIEPVPAAIAQPANSVSVTDFGAVGNGSTDCLAAFNSAVTAAVSQGKSLYIPAGQFNLSSMWVVGSVASPINALTITGAGIWYTNIQFTNSAVSGGGISLRMAATGKLDFGDIYLNSRLRSRYGQQAIYKCFMDNFGTNSHIHDFWEEHFECGFWVGDYAHTPAIAADGLLIENGRIRNNLADGCNFCQGTKNSTVQNCSLRNNGDDSLAVWPDSTMNAPMGVNDTFSHNTVENNWRAGGIAFFGGSGHKAQFNYIKDSFMGSGIRLNTTFPGFHFETNTGILISDTTIINCGTSQDTYNNECGAIETQANSSAINNITFTNINIIDSQRNAIQFGYGGGYTGVVFNNINIDGTGLDAITRSTFAVPHGGAAVFSYTGNGTVTFNHLTYTNVENVPPMIIPSGFNVIVNP